MSARKNIFLIGRRPNDEDQLTEMVAFLWQEVPETLEAWLLGIGLPTPVGAAEVETQFTLPSGKRPDIVIRSDEGTTIIESKLGSGFGDDQTQNYLRYLGTLAGRRALVLLTQRPEPLRAADQELATQLGVRLIEERWQAMAQHLGHPGEETLSGDFIQLLIREGLVKPEPLATSDLDALNAGYNVFIRLESLLGELDTHVARLLPGAKGRSGATKFWTWRVWNATNVDVGLAFLAAEWTSRPHTEPVAHAWVLNRVSTEEDKLRAVGAEAGNRTKWRENAQLRATYGLGPFGPAIGRPLREVLVGATFDDQVSSAANFMREAVEFFTGRGYLPRR